MSHETPLKHGRIRVVDALRGLALCGIVFVNIPQTLGMMDAIADAPATLRLFVHGKFYPIFCLLFGVGFGVFLRTAAARGDDARTLLARRMLALAAIGALHHLLQPGEVLLPYAITGMAVLLPLSYAPAKVNVAVSGVLLSAGVLAGLGGFGMLPGLFALGFALAQLDVPQTLESRRRQLAATALALSAVAAAAYWPIARGLPEPVSLRLGVLFSTAVAGVYACVFLLAALRPRIGTALSAVLAPMGRMALTNYIAATLLFVPLGAALGLRDSDAWGTSAALGAAILLAQAAWSPLWLREFGYGPLEWLWRRVTYWRPLPIRRDRSEPASAEASTP
ncbi:MAG: DUF418 domain-containing protein [Stackebrandtia sp.]